MDPFKNTKEFTVGGNILYKELDLRMKINLLCDSIRWSSFSLALKYDGEKHKTYCFRL